jgi:type VI secretion system protein ImpK
MSTPEKKTEPHVSATALATVSVPLNVRLKVAERAANPLLEAARPLLTAIESTPTQLDDEGAGQRHQWLMHEIRLFDRVCTELGLRPDHVEHIRYTIAAALDEATFQQPWAREDAGNAKWSQGIAVALGYGRQGGDQVFRQIERALHSPQENAPLLDVFQRILATGFMGRYRHDRGGRAQLAAINASLSRALNTGRPQPFPYARDVPGAGNPRGLNGQRWSGDQRIALPIRVAAAIQMRRRRLIAAGLLAAILIVPALLWNLHRILEPAPPPPPPLDLLGQRLDTRFHSEIAGGTLSLSENPAHTAITLTFSDMFAPGKATPHVWLTPFIIAAGEQIATLPLKTDVTGHTDSLPSRQGNVSNQALSQARAESVRQLLLAAGVAPERVSTTGKGDADPLSDNVTDAGRARNRRVEITVTQIASMSALPESPSPSVASETREASPETNAPRHVSPTGSHPGVAGSPSAI